MATLKVVNREKESVSYKIMDLNSIKASHRPNNGFLPNPDYAYENERLYHKEQASQDKVIEIASKLDPEELLANLYATTGAPIIDKNNNVLGGNGRSMAIMFASEHMSKVYENYCNSIMEYAEMVGIDFDNEIEKPILVRQLDREIDKKDAEDLISALNDNPTDSKNDKADARSRGMRFSNKTLNIFAHDIQNFDTIKKYFDSSDSKEIVQSIITDGVILPNEKNKYLDSDGFLRPAGKDLVIKALRSMLVSSYEIMDKLPERVLEKLDAIISYVIIASRIIGWDIRENLSLACDLLVQYKASGESLPEVFLNKIDMLSGKALSDICDPLSIQLFHYLLNSNKKDMVYMFKGYCNMALQSVENNAFPGLGKNWHDTILYYFGVDIDAKIHNWTITYTANKKDNAKTESEPMHENIDNPEKIENKGKKMRTQKRDCDKQNSKLIKAITTNNIQEIMDYANSILGKNEIVPTCKTQNRIEIDGQDSGYRIIRSGRQWQLRLLNEFDKIQSKNTEKMDNASESIIADNANMEQEQEYMADAVIDNEQVIFNVITELENIGYIQGKYGDLEIVTYGGTIGGSINPQGKRRITIGIKNKDAQINIYAQYGWDNPVNLTYDNNLSPFFIAYDFHNKLADWDKSTGDYENSQFEPLQSIEIQSCQDNKIDMSQFLAHKYAYCDYLPTPEQDNNTPCHKTGDIDYSIIENLDCKHIEFSQNMAEHYNAQFIYTYYSYCREILDRRPYTDCQETYNYLVDINANQDIVNKHKQELIDVINETTANYAAYAQYLEKAITNASNNKALAIKENKITNLPCKIIQFQSNNAPCDNASHEIKHDCQLAYAIGMDLPMAKTRITNNAMAIHKNKAYAENMEYTGNNKSHVQNKCQRPLLTCRVISGDHIKAMQMPLFIKRL